MSKTNDSTDIIFANPLHLPLEQLYLKIWTRRGREEKKGLDKFWVAARVYPSYTSIPNDDSQESKMIWVKRATNYIKALIFLRNLEYYKFWSHIVYDPGVTQFLVSFLKKAIPPYQLQPDGDLGDSYSRIYNLVFSIYKRILTASESETEYMQPETLGKLLSDNKIITNATIWDLVRIYGNSDDGTLSNMLKFTYNIMPKQQNELRLSITKLLDIFDAIGTVAYENSEVTETLLINFTNLLFDTIVSIHMFMKVYEPFKKICITEDCYSKIVHIYESEIPLLVQLMKSIIIHDNHPAYDKINDAYAEFLQICNSLLTSCLDIILQIQDNEKARGEWSTIYFNLISATVAEKQFLTDFNAVYPLSQDIEMFMSICPYIDQEKFDCILSKLNEQQMNGNEAGASAASKITTVEHLNKEFQDNDIPEYMLNESKITQVLDVLPDLGDGFIEKCLLAMNNDPQAVIMAILEGNLPPDLNNVDRSLPRIPPEAELEEITENIKSAYIGKKPSEYKNITEMLNDKSHIKTQKEKFTIYGLIPDEDHLYDDDYDERYDQKDVVILDDDDRERAPRSRFRFDKSDEEETEEETEDNKVENPASKRDAFCEDPAVIRARREAKYQQTHPPRNREVCGKPKGQGQDKQVLQNRDRKNTHKSSAANHNRKAGAQWKRSKGFIPS